ncbi:YeaC family protein [Ferrimonas marina]|uniref:DUF1315 family protein n=1 Tax=Ferrimonas marina TaxID=299255 RepID=A0A1M5NAW5_9GAMM|nr:DUF1315 family protein [Ferrimonas marina]SHG86133.1 hypothetical protein SAMN02745129_0944 [Ferrimonas marina]
MEWQQMIDSLTPELVERLQYGVETGKWPDGTPLTDEQRDSAMQAVMLWQARHDDQHQHLTVGSGGQLNQLSKAELKRQFVEEPITRLKPE